MANSDIQIKMSLSFCHQGDRNSWINMSESSPFSIVRLSKTNFLQVTNCLKRISLLSKNTYRSKNFAAGNGMDCLTRCHVGAVRSKDVAQ